MPTSPISDLEIFPLLSLFILFKVLLLLTSISVTNDTSLKIPPEMQGCCKSMSQQSLHPSLGHRDSAQGSGLYTNLKAILDFYLPSHCCPWKQGQQALLSEHWSLGAVIFDPSNRNRNPCSLLWGFCSSLPLCWNSSFSPVPSQLLPLLSSSKQIEFSRKEERRRQSTVGFVVRGIQLLHRQIWGSP